MILSPTILSYMLLSPDESALGVFPLGWAGFLFNIY